MVSSRFLNESTASNFSAAFYPPCSSDNDPDSLTSQFNKHCLSILDNVCPVRTRSVMAVNSTPWFNDSLKRQCRKIEPLWKKTHLHVHLLHLKDLLTSFTFAVRDARVSYFSNLVSQSKGNPKVLFNTISSTVSPATPTASIHSVTDCENFLSFFVDKVNKVRSSISPSALSPPLPTPTRPIILDSFAHVSLPELTKLVNSVKTSACPLDILPSLFKSAFQSMGPSVFSIINVSLVSGQVPAYFKNAVIHPLLKKPSLDPSLHSSFRPISKLPFISKILEKVVAKQLTAALDGHNIYDSFQSGFRRAHSTETALLGVSNDLLTHSDAGDCSVLVLLDLTKAFDTVDHLLLLERLRDWVGLSATALQWLSSYLSERSFSVAVTKFRSSTPSLTHGVPQGSVLGPLLFLLYLLPLQHILSSFKGISYHLYADNTQLYISFKSHEMSKLQLLCTCLDSIKTWMAGSFLQLKEDKTEILICAPDKLVPKVRDSLGQLASHTKPSIRNLGVTFDPALTLDSHVSSLVRSYFFHLRNIAKLSPILPHSELETVIYTFISSHLDFSNSLFTCLSRTSLNRVQVAQNACARLLTNSFKHTYITLLLLQLHWLPVNFRVHFNILFLVYRALHGQAPSYIGDLLTPYTPSRSLRSSDQSLLVVQHQAKAKGDRSFAVVAPRLWNSHP
uniref:Reverse transcriptase domain-containing protein n=1 Tax=Nothobranchius furzeri TaxID=105023 RepID=A0A8C6W0R4_NOTFU